MMNGPLCAAFFPKALDSSRNPYLYLLKTELEKIDCSLAADNPNQLSFSWLIQNRKKVSILHFHWHQFQYINVDKRKLTWKGLFRFVFGLFLSRVLGYKIVWTMHNTVPHENPYPRVDYLVQWVLSRTANAVIVHCRYAREFLKKSYQREERVFLLNHPTLKDVYPDSVSKMEARSKLDIPEGGRVFVYLGEIRMYKGIDLLLQAFQSYRNPDAVLIIAGNPLFEEVSRSFLPYLEKDVRIKTIFKYIPQEDVQMYYKAADAVVFPFSRITMSGSLFLAMAFQKAVIVPDLGGLPEYVNSSNGIVYRAAEENGLLHALELSDSLDLKELGENAYRTVKDFTQKRFAEETMNIYKSIN